MAQHAVAERNGQALLDLPTRRQAGDGRAERDEHRQAIAQARQRHSQQCESAEARAERQYTAERPEADGHDRQKRQSDG